jgi:hypothetical protein
VPCRKNARVRIRAVVFCTHARLHENAVRVLWDTLVSAIVASEPELSGVVNNVATTTVAGGHFSIADTTTGVFTAVSQTSDGQSVVYTK